MALPALVGFGPITTLPSVESLSHVRNTISSDERLEPLLNALRTLEGLWATLIDHDPHLHSDSGPETCKWFQQWIDGEVDDLPSTTSNLLLSPLTVVIQIAQYFQYLKRSESDVTHTSILRSVRESGIQGLCIGFLNATTLSASEDETSIGRNVSVALSLAFCIGAIVDHGSRSADGLNNVDCITVRCREEGGYRKIMKILEGESTVSSVFESLAYLVRFINSKF